jgi:hypothetical protein
VVPTRVGVMVALLSVISAYGWATTHLVSKREFAVVQSRQDEALTRLPRWRPRSPRGGPSHLGGSRRSRDTAQAEPREH